MNTDGGDASPECQAIHETRKVVKFHFKCHICTLNLLIHERMYTLSCTGIRLQNITCSTKEISQHP